MTTAAAVDRLADRVRLEVDSGRSLAAQFADHGWRVIAVDVQPGVVAAINEGRSHVGEEPDLAELVSRAHAGGLLSATLDGAAAARVADVVVLIVPVMLALTSSQRGCEVSSSGFRRNAITHLPSLMCQAQWARRVPSSRSSSDNVTRMV